MTFFGSPCGALHLDVEVIAAVAAARETDIADVREAAPQMREQRRFARDAAEQEVLEPAADDRVEDGPARCVTASTSITWRLARGP